MDVVGKIIALIITVIAVFVAPLVSMSSANDAVTQSTVYDITSDFVDDVRECGCVTQERYLQFIKDLDNTGNLYDVEITHSHDVVNPVFGNGGVVVGTNDATEYYYNDDILHDVYSDTGAYLMSKGDTFSMTVYNRDKTTAQRIRQMVFNYVDESRPIYVQYGGVIRDEAY